MILLTKLSATLILFLTLASTAFAQAGTTTAQTQTTTPEEDQAIEEINDDFIEISTPSADVEAEDEVKYFLPYPGLLPDHPLYFLKSFRDTIVGMLISDPVKKAEFSLHNADKKINAALTLAEKNKQDLVVEMLDQSKQHLQDVIQRISEAREQEKDYRTILDRSRTAVRKHDEVVDDIKTHLDAPSTQQAEEYQNFLSDSLRKLQQIK